MKRNCQIIMVWQFFCKYKQKNSNVLAKGGNVRKNMFTKDIWIYF